MTSDSKKGQPGKNSGYADHSNTPGKDSDEKTTREHEQDSRKEK